MNKKRGLIFGMFLVNPIALIVLLTIIIFFVAIFVYSSETTGIEQSIIGIRDANNGLSDISVYLDSSLEFKNTNITVSDLIKLHCDSSMFDKIKENTNFLNLPFPFVIAIACPGKGDEVIRGPICDNPKEIIYFKSSAEKIKIKYCIRPDKTTVSRFNLWTPDKKGWQIQSIGEKDIFWEQPGITGTVKKEKELRFFYAQYTKQNLKGAPVQNE